MTETADEILEKTRRKTQPWVTADEILDPSDQSRNLKKVKNKTNGAEAYR